MTLATVSTRSPDFDYQKFERRQHPRHEDDWYQDPPNVTEALLRVEPLWGTVWDPCCGGGTIPDTLHAAGITSVGSDIVDRAGGRFLTPIDFLADAPPGLSEATSHIVMNPPYRDAREFVDRARAIAKHKVAALCRLAFLEGSKRRAWFEETRLSRVWVFSDRVSMPPGDALADGAVKAEGGKVAYAWFVWDRSHRGPPVLGWISSRSAG